MKELSFDPFPVLVTPRLRLRALEIQDASLIYKLRTSEPNNKYLDLPVPASVEDCESYIDRIQKGVAHNRHVYWIIELETTKESVGTICLWNFSVDRMTAELGYELAHSAQGLGYMSEALAAIIEYATTICKFSRLEAYTHCDHMASVKLLRRFDFSKVGEKEDVHSFTKEAFTYAVYAREY